MYLTFHPSSIDQNIPFLLSLDARPQDQVDLWCKVLAEIKNKKRIN